MKITKEDFTELVQSYVEVSQWAQDTYDENILSEHYLEEIPVFQCYTEIFEKIGFVWDVFNGYEYNLEDYISERFVWNKPKEDFDFEKTCEEVYNSLVRNECKENENGKD